MLNRRIKETFKKAVNAIEEFSPKALVLIDYPEFNIRLAKVAKKKGIKVLYYVSPSGVGMAEGQSKDNCRGIRQDCSDTAV